MPDYLSRQNGTERDPFENWDGTMKPAKMNDVPRNAVSLPVREPGIYINLPFADYIAIDALSNSRMKLATRSLKHYRESQWKEPTKAMAFGSLCHTGKLEPLAIAQRYAVLPDFENDEANLTAKGERPASPKATGYYKDKVRSFTEANRDKEIIEAAEYDKMLGIVNALAADEIAGEWFGAVGYVEVSLVWECPDTGMLCKARCDHASKDWQRITDLKTTQDALEFNHSLARFGYHRQAAHYLQGVKVLTGTDAEFGIVAIETDGPPFCPRSAPVHPESIAIGAAELLEIKRDIQAAMEDGEWPGYSNPDHWMLPAWYEAKHGEPISLVVNGETLEV